MPKKAPEALKSKASGCGRKTEQGWNRVEHLVEQPAVQEARSACGRSKGSIHFGLDDNAGARDDTEVQPVTVPVCPY